MRGLSIVLSLQTDLDPGCFRFAVDPTAIGPKDVDQIDRLERTGRLISQLLNGEERIVAVRFQHMRGYGETRTPSGPSSRAPSRILVSGTREVPVIGPGGAVTLHMRDDQIYGMSAVRPVRPLTEGSWRRVDAVLEVLDPFVEQGLEVFPEFGYFEQSWLDTQTVVPPAFSFTVEGQADGRWPFRREIILPATREDLLRGRESIPELDL